MDKTKIITLCGSMRFIKFFREIEMMLTRQDSIVLSPVFGEGMTLSEKDTKLLGEHHLKKIDLSDEIFVIDIDGYIGKSTRKEIRYAINNGKKIRYFSKEIVI